MSAKLSFARTVCFVISNTFMMCHTAAVPLRQAGLFFVCMLVQVIRSTYELEVVARSGCCLSNARLTHPIVINDPQPHIAPPLLQPPLGWAPQVSVKWPEAGPCHVPSMAFVNELLQSETACWQMQYDCLCFVLEKREGVGICNKDRDLPHMPPLSIC